MNKIPEGACGAVTELPMPKHQRLIERVNRLSNAIDNLEFMSIEMQQGQGVAQMPRGDDGVIAEQVSLLTALENEPDRIDQQIERINIVIEQLRRAFL